MELFKINNYLYINKNEMIFSKKKFTFKIIKILILYFILLFFKYNIIYTLKLKNKRNVIKNMNLIPLDKYYINSYIYFYVTNFNYSMSFKYNIAKIKYNIAFYDSNNNIIFPTEVILNNNLRIFCHINIKNNNISVYSLANINNNKFFSCIEFFNINENISFGIKINHINLESNYYNVYLNLENNLNYNNFIYENDKLFDPLFINNEYKYILNKINDQTINETLKLKKSYIKYPLCILKRNILFINNKWRFRNIYNHHFCFCNGLNCLNINATENCKYKFYLNIIDNTIKYNNLSINNYIVI